MKQLTRRVIRSACTGAIMLSVSPWLAAQAPNSAPPNPAPPAAAGAPPISSEQASYLFGLTLGNQLHGVGVGSELSLDSITRGVKDGIQGKKSTPADIQQIQQYVHTQMLAAATRNKTAAEEFLASNGKKPGVRTTASGLEYKIDKAGDAKAPAITPADEATVNYRGTLLDGSEFDSSESHGRPLDVPVGGGIIKGWQEALVMMKPGAKWTLYIPPDLAYGANPRPGIPGNSLLTFDIEVLSVKPKPASPTPQPQAQKPGAPLPQ
jgi:FKBP-type peptidyl-prolyl cis-trans isomerase